DGKSEVIMAMRRNDHTLYAANAFTNIANQVAELQGDRIADGVWNVQRGRAGLNDGFEHLEKKLRFGAGRIFWRKLDVIAKRARQADGLCRLLQALLTRDPQLVLQVYVRSREKYVYARTNRRA